MILQRKCTAELLPIYYGVVVSMFQCGITLPYLTLPYLTLPYLTLPYLTLPYLTLPYLTLPYLTLPYLTYLYTYILTFSTYKSANKKNYRLSTLSMKDSNLVFMALTKASLVDLNLILAGTSNPPYSKSK